MKHEKHGKTSIVEEALPIGRQVPYHPSHNLAQKTNRSFTDLPYDAPRDKSQRLRTKSSASSLNPIANPYSTITRGTSYDAGGLYGTSKELNRSSTSLNNKSKPALSPAPSKIYGLDKKSNTSRPSHDVRSYGDFDYDEGFGKSAEDHIQLTFEDHSTSWKDPTPQISFERPLAAPNKATTWGSLSTGARSPEYMGYGTPSPKRSFDVSRDAGRRSTSAYQYGSTPGTPQYPDRQKVQSPSLAPPVNQSQKAKNPWADEEDEFGWEREQGMTMSFE